MHVEEHAPAAPAVDPALQAEADAALAAAPADEFGGELDAAPAEQPASEETAQLCASLLEVTCNQLLAAKHGDHWRISKEEAKALGAAYGAVLDKYFPNMRSGPELTAVLLTAAVFGPRVAETAARRSHEGKGNSDGGTHEGQPRAAQSRGTFGTAGANE